MGLDWVKLFADLPDHPKIMKLERVVGIRAFDYTTRALLWLSKFRADGNTLGVELEMERAVRWEGQQGVLMQAWRDKGWIDHDGFWHDWDEIQTAHKERADNAKRQKSRRDAAKAKTRAESAPPNAQQHSFDLDRNVTVTSERVTVTSERANVTVTSHENVTVTSRDTQKQGGEKASQNGMSQNVTVTDEIERSRGLESEFLQKEAPSRLVTVTSPLLSSPLVSSASEGGPGGGDLVLASDPQILPPLPPNIREVGGGMVPVGSVLRAITRSMRPPRSSTVVGLMEAEVRCKTADAYMASAKGRSIVQRFPALDGVNGRLTAAELVREMWDRYTTKAIEYGTQDADIALLRWIAEDYQRFKRSYDLDRAHRPNEIAPAPSKPKPTREQLHAECTRMQERARADVSGEARDAIELPPPPSDSERWRAWFQKHRNTVVQMALMKLGAT